MLSICSVEMNRVHVYQTLRVIPAEAVYVPLDTLLQNIVVPSREPGLTTQDQRDRWVKKFHCLGPLVGALRVVFLCKLLNLPWTPAFVAQSPIFDLKKF